MFMTPTRPTFGKARTDSIEWLPAERLGQLSVDERVRPWLIGGLERGSYEFAWLPAVGRA